MIYIWVENLSKLQNLCVFLQLRMNDLICLEWTASYIKFMLFSEKYFSKVSTRKKNFPHNKGQFNAFAICSTMKMFEQDPPVLLQNYISAYGHMPLYIS